MSTNKNANMQFNSSTTKVTLASNAESITVKDGRNIQTFPINGTPVVLNNLEGSLLAGSRKLKSTLTTENIAITEHLGMAFDHNTQMLVIGSTDISSGVASENSRSSNGSPNVIGSTDIGGGLVSIDFQFFIGQDSSGKQGASVTKSGSQLVVTHGLIS